MALLPTIAGGAADLVIDDPRTRLSFHVVLGVPILAGSLLMAMTLWPGWWRSGPPSWRAARTHVSACGCDRNPDIGDRRRGRRETPAP
ncbi:MAG: hypothetical protein ACYC2G_08440 [Gemmatimonadaceae bacterium]